MNTMTADVLHGNAESWGISFYGIDPSYKSHDASYIYPTMHHFVTEIWTHVLISVTKWCIDNGISDWCIVGFVRWVYWTSSPGQFRRQHQNCW